MENLIKILEEYKKEADYRVLLMEEVIRQTKLFLFGRKQSS